jgi:prevent-host-death family protein
MMATDVLQLWVQGEYAAGTALVADLDEVVTHDCRVTMKTVGVAEFKSRLSEYLRNVRKGHDLVILDRDQPIARVIPHTASGPLVVREPIKGYRTLGDLPLPTPARLRTDAVALLLEDRRADE